ncbi:hypothetical protein [Cryobacterium aureum]|uniref:variant leucine-rich repeat-containing protein n=1 Tax=Cryobacterium aureum TaxID=995037 RepID=UPI000CF54B29|nr:hypothetical protein [Cryobacterium aureum]
MTGLDIAPPAKSPEPFSYTLADLADPGVEPATLGHIATARPDLWSVILTHPNCYPELADWLRQRMPRADEQTPARGWVEPSAQRTARRAPRREPFAKHHPWVLFIVPVAAIIAILSLFLPIGTVSGFGDSITYNYFSEEAKEFEGEGEGILTFMLVAIALAVVSILTRKKWARITAAIVGILVAPFGIGDGFGTTGLLLNTTGASVGAGSVLLGSASTLLLAAAILTLLPQRRSRAQQTTDHSAPLEAE